MGGRHWPAAGMPSGSPGAWRRRFARCQRADGWSLFGVSLSRGEQPGACFGSGRKQTRGTDRQTDRQTRRGPRCGAMRCDAKPARQISASSRLPSQRHAAESCLVQDPRFASLGRRSSIGARASLVSHFPLRLSLRFFCACRPSVRADTPNQAVPQSHNLEQSVVAVSSDFFPEGPSTVRTVFLSLAPLLVMIMMTCCVLSVLLDRVNARDDDGVGSVVTA